MLFAGILASFAMAASSATVVQPQSIEAAMAAQAKAETLGWLSGGWEAELAQPEGAQPAWTDESWTTPRGGILIGIGRRGVGHRIGMWEVMRIATDAAGETALHVTSDDGSSTSFALVRSAGTEAVFENPAHDYPQRIGYRRNGAELEAWISRIDGSNERRWSFRPATPPSR
jgi:hypothetical protein